MSDPQPKAFDMVDILRESIAATLGDDLLGLYLYGSLLAGDFDPDTSDLDLLAVTADDVDDDQFARLLVLHEALAAEYPDWANRIEAQYYAAAALRAFKTRRSPMVGISPGEPLNRKEAGHDWLLNWYFVLDYGRTLLGPDPAAFIPPIDHAEFVAASARDAQYWRGWTAKPRPIREQSYATLTLCRALATAETGQRFSKPAAARYVQAAHPQWAAHIDNALRWRTAPAADLPDGSTAWPTTAAFVAFALGRIGS